MKSSIKALFAIVLFMLLPNMTFAQESISTYNLRINNTELGSDNTEHLCFSWNINSDMRGFNQIAYQIELSSNNKVIWNSGKINSSESILVPYNGSQLNPATKYDWKVKIWSENEKTSAGFRE